MLMKMGSKASSSCDMSKHVCIEIVNNFIIWRIDRLSCRATFELGCGCGCALASAVARDDDDDDDVMTSLLTECIWVCVCVWV